MSSQVVAVVLSSVIPGLGQLYSGHFLRSLFIFAAILVLIAVGWVLHIPWITPLFFIMLAFLLWLWNVYDAYQLNETNTEYAY